MIVPVEIPALVRIPARRPRASAVEVTSAMSGPGAMVNRTISPRAPMIRPSRRSSTSDARLVLAGPRVDPDRVALLDEDRDGHDEARLGCGRFAGAGLGVAGEARLRLAH